MTIKRRKPAPAASSTPTATPPSPPAPFNPAVYDPGPTVSHHTSGYDCGTTSHDSSSYTSYDSGSTCDSGSY